MPLRTIRETRLGGKDCWVHILLAEDTGVFANKEKPLYLSWSTLGLIPYDVPLESGHFDNPVLALEAFAAFVSRVKEKGFREIG